MSQQRTMAALWLRRAGVLLAMCAAVAAHAQNAIESVTTSMQSGSEVVRIDLTQPLSTAPAGFAIQTPARIALPRPANQVVAASAAIAGIRRSSSSSRIRAAVSAPR